MILDTSLLFDAVIVGSRTRAARRLMTESERLSAPTLIRVELAGALTRAVRRKEISDKDARSAYESAEELLPETESDLPLIPRALEFSLELSHPCADCVFLALAERHN